MTVSCPDCRSVFRVDPAKVPATGVRARCSVCGGVIAIAGGTLPVSVTPGVAGRDRLAGRVRGRLVRRPSGRRRTGRRGRPTPVAPADDDATGAGAPLPGVDAGVRRDRHAHAHAVGEARRPSPSATPVAVAAGRRPPPSTGTTATATPTPRSINPFLNADPGQRARRLARALVSDLVAYHPQKREEGLRDGTLRQLFREEIKKSYEEYVEQVGREVAEGSPHFQDALNEILAGGRTPVLTR